MVQTLDENFKQFAFKKNIRIPKLFDGLFTIFDEKWKGKITESFVFLNWASNTDEQNTDTPRLVSSVKEGERSIMVSVAKNSLEASHELFL